MLGSTGRESGPSAVRGADHVVQLYEHGLFPTSSIGQFLGSALGAGEAAVVIATEEHRALIAERLAWQSIDLATVKERGQLVLLDAATTLAGLMRHGKPDPLRFDILIGEQARQALAVWGGVSVFGEMIALLTAERDFDAALALDRLWSQAVRDIGMALMSAYPLSNFSDKEGKASLDDLCREARCVFPSEISPSQSDGENRRRVFSAQSQPSPSLESDLATQELTRTREVLRRVALTLVAEKDIGEVVQIVTDAGCELLGAAFGAFFYNLKDERGESYTLYKLSGAPPEAFANFPMPRNTEIFAPTFSGERIVRSGDITQDPNYGKSGPYFGMPPGHLPVRSYLAVPVISKTGEVLGGLFFGNPQPDVFSEASEQVIVSLAAQAAVAIDNAHLHLAVQRDVRALRRAEETSRRLAAIVESSDDAIIGKSLEGIIETWNSGAQRLFGYTAEEAIGQPVTMLFPPEHINEEPSIIARIQRGERVEHYETQRQRKDGSRVEISLTISPIRAEDGTIVGASKIARDISRRKAAEAALQEATVALARSRDELEERVAERTSSLREAIAQMEEFSYTVSHDLRAPLRAMNVHCAVLTDDFRALLETEPEALKSVQRISENAIRLDKMIRDVLTYGRVARDELKMEPLSLDKLVRDTISHYPVLQPPLADIQVEALGDVMGHEPSLIQILSNLLNNAVKFIAEGVHPTVRLWTERGDGHVRLWVEDNGIGIDPEYHHRLFSMFERIHPKLPYEGTGVGLAIVKKAAERMGGRVGMESNPSQGSRFWVEFPEVT